MTDTMRLTGIKPAVGLVVCVLGSCGKQDVEIGRPWEQVEKSTQKTDHSRLFDATGFADGPAVTRACLKCHPESGPDPEKIPKRKYQTKVKGIGQKVRKKGGCG